MFTGAEGDSVQGDASSDHFWLRDGSLEDLASLPEPHVMPAEIAEEPRSAQEQIESILEDLPERMLRRS